jgi:hypothetical protein
MLVHLTTEFNFMKKKHVILLFALIAVGSAFYVYKWVNKPVAKVSEAVCKVKISATELFDAYTNNVSKADSCYTNQLIEVFGKVKSISTDGPNKSLMLETNDMLFGIDCGIDSTNHEKLKSLTEGQDVTIRGECSGMLSDVVMIRCIIL